MQNFENACHIYSVQEKDMFLYGIGPLSVAPSCLLAPKLAGLHYRALSDGGCGLELTLLFVRMWVHPVCGFWLHTEGTDEQSR